MPKLAPSPITTIAEADIDSQSSSPTLNSASTSSTINQPLLSPTSRSFFEAVSSKLRTRSRSPAAKHLSTSRVATPRARSPNPRKSRSRSPNPATTANTMAQTSSHRPAAVPVQPTSKAGDSSTSSFSSVSMKRQSSSGSERSEWEKMTYGRHSGDWLFDGVSLRGSIKRVLGSKGDSTPN